MNFIISIVSPKDLEELNDIYKELSVPIFVTLMGKGTATKSTLELLGIESIKRRIVLAAANTEKSLQLIKEIKKRLYVQVPGHGVVISIPLKSIGGGRAVNVLSDGEKPSKNMPDINHEYELIVGIANEGCTEDVMNAARSAGARGGTVLHGKGTATKEAAKFLNISIASEKEVILIVAKCDKKKEIMQAILEKAGPGKEAGVILFSVPVSSVDGLALAEDAKA